MKQIKLTLLFCLTAFLPLMAQNLQPVPMDTAIRYGKLSNGLTYYIRHNEQPKHRAEFYIAQNVGAILEEDNQNGLAHFLEHMCFNGTKNYPGKTFLNYFESNGVKFGYNINAYTSLDETVYNLSEIPTQREGLIDSALLILHDWSNFVLLEDKEIDEERGVIREEWRTRMNASRRLYKEQAKKLYAGSPYAKRDIIGDTAVINNFTYQELRDYYKKWYRPDLQAILVVGDIDVDKMEAKIKTMFADIPAPVNPAERTYFEVPDNEQPIVGVFTDPEATTQEVTLLFKMKALPKEVRLSTAGASIGFANGLIGSILGERFAQITEEPNTPFRNAYAGIGSQVRTLDGFTFGCNPVMGKEKEARERLLREAEIVRRHGFTETELERAKTRTMSYLEKLYNERDQQKNNALVREYTRNFTRDEPIGGIEWELNFAKTLFPHITASILNNMAAQYLGNKNIVYIIEGPSKDSLSYPTEEEMVAELSLAREKEVQAYKDSVSNDPLIAKMPKPGKVKKVTENKALGTTEWQLSNGIRVILKPTKFKDDEIRMAAWSKGGKSLLATEDLASANHAVAVMSECGLGSFSQSELRKKLAGKIASVGCYLSSYEEGLSGSSSVKDCETMLQLAYLKFTGSRVDQNAYDLYMKSYKTQLENAALNPMKDFSDSLQMTLFNHNPRVVLQNMDTYNKVNYADIQRIYKDRFANPADFTFQFVGNIDLATFKPLVETYLGGLKTSKVRENWKDVGMNIQKGKVRKDVYKELKTNKTTNFLFFSGEIPYTLKSIVEMGAMADLLDLRYTEVIREREGATYGVSVYGASSNEPKEEYSLEIYFDTDPKLYQRMDSLCYDEIKTIAEKGPKPEDLNKVKLNLMKQYKEDILENGWWMSTIGSFYKDGINNATDYEKTVEALNAESFSALAKEMLRQGNLIEVFLQPQP